VFQASTVRPVRQPPYSVTATRRLSGGSLRTLASLVVLGLAASGCSYRLSNEPVAETGSVKLATAAAAAEGAGPAAADLALAKAAVNDLMSRDDETASVPWENPRTGARGAVTPIAAAYSQDGFTCRDFLASYVRGGSESWLQGEACRLHRGKWEVKALRPLKKT
jgi:surface antigen